MRNEQQIKRLQRLLLAGTVVIVFLVGYGFGGQGKGAKATNPNQKTSQKAGTKKDIELTQKEVKAFLVAYFTKKDLEENRERYRPFMTQSLYRSEVNQEDKAVNQTYKGYVVDYAFQSADIYVDAVNKTAIVQVKYTNTLLAKKHNYDRAQTNVLNETTLKLTYTKQDNKLLVNNKEVLLLTSNTGPSSSYPDYGRLQEEEATDPSTADAGSEQ